MEQHYSKGMSISMQNYDIMFSDSPV